MKRLLLLMGSETYRAPDFVAAARRLDVDLVVGTDALGGAEVLLPEKNLVLSFDDVEAACAAIGGAHRRAPFDAIVSVDDSAVVMAARASEQLGLVGNPAESAASASNKAVFRDILRAAGLPGPWFREVALDADPRQVAREVTYPCVLKPLFLSASRGVIRANDAREFAAAFARIGRILADPDVSRRGGPLARRVLVEEFIPGAEVALEGMLIEGAFHLLAWFDKPEPLDGPFFEETIFVTPSRHPLSHQAAAMAAVGDAARALGLRTGPVHAELRLRPEVRLRPAARLRPDAQLGAVSRLGPEAEAVTPILVEIATRSIGGHCSRSLVFGAGRSLEELILRQALGLPPADGGARREAQASGVIMLPIPRAGILR